MWYFKEFLKYVYSLGTPQGNEESTKGLPIIISISFVICSKFPQGFECYIEVLDS